MIKITARSGEGFVIEVDEPTKQAMINRLRISPDSDASSFGDLIAELCDDGEVGTKDKSLKEIVVHLLHEMM